MGDIESEVPTSRVRACSRAQVRALGEVVVYWMIAQRRLRWNFALQRAADWAEALGKPLLIFEPLRCGYRWASDRLHTFVLQGMEHHAQQNLPRGVRYFPYVEPQEGAGSGLLEALARRAAVVVTDDFPCFFLPRMVAAVAERLPVRLEAVDSNGIYPMRSTDRVFTRAVDFRRHLQKRLPDHFADFPREDPMRDRDLPAFSGEWKRGLPKEIVDAWPPPSQALLQAQPKALAELPIDHTVRPVTYRGGRAVGSEVLDHFLDDRLSRYLDGRMDVLDRATSELSPYLHFGHISAHEIFDAIARREEWAPDRTAKANGSRAGWWGMSKEAEAFLDQLITWRELGYNICALTDDFDTYEALPAWARKTLEEHASDEREYLYDLQTLEAAHTHDPLWNAAQRELLRDGRIHNYLRMLWGKKVLEWTAHPRDAVDILLHLNNRYCVDGRNPNSYSGVFWCLGRYDRAWGPERPIFGKIRFMSSDSTRRKLDAKGYMARFAREAQARMIF